MPKGLRTSSRFKALTSISLALAALFLGVGKAESPDDYFHRGAQNYAFQKMKQALVEVAAGRQKFPDDQALKDLEELLKQKQQENQQSKDDQKDQSKQDKSQQDQSKQDQQSKEDQKKQQDQNKADQQKPQPGQDKEDKKPEDKQAQQKPDASKDDKKQAESQQGKDSKDKNPDQPEDQQAQAGKAMMVQMTPQEARQLLDAQKSEEKAMIFIPKLKTNRTDRAFKDW